MMTLAERSPSRYGQGAFFGRPMPVEDLVNQLKGRDQVTLFDPVILDG